MLKLAFTKVLLKNQKKNISSRAQSYPELYQTPLFPNVEMPEKLVWAYAIETDTEGLTTNIQFFAMTENGIVIAAHNVPIHNVLSTLYPINTFESTPTNLEPAPVSLTGIETIKVINKAKK